MTESASRPISDRWELTERIGSGAMGEVWRGRHRMLGHDVAVKVMKRDASRDQSLVARFLREARISAQLRHRNIARVEDFGTTPEAKPFLVMELLSGVTLEDLIERGDRVDRARVLTIARHVGAACDVAHAQGIVHRDLKPANCFLLRDEDGADLVKVLDFGVAKVSDGLLATQHAPGGFSLIGTPVYMSPEQARGDTQVDHRSDLWSLGAMLYELLTGHLPFQGESLPHLLLAIQGGAFTPPSAHDRALSPSVDAWAARALAREPSQRFQSGRELADALSIALAGSLDAPRPSAPPFAYAPTASLASVPLAAISSPPAPGTLAPTQPMRVVDASLAPAPIAPPALGVSTAPLAVPTRTTVPPVAWLAGAALVGIGVIVAVIATRASDASPAPTPAPTAIAPTPVQPIPVAPAPAPAPALHVARPARTAQEVPAPSPAPAPRPARVQEAPLPARRVEPALAPSPIVTAPVAQPAPSAHAPYNPDEP